MANKDPAELHFGPSTIRQESTQSDRRISPKDAKGLISYWKRPPEDRDPNATNKAL